MTVDVYYLSHLPSFFIRTIESYMKAILEFNLPEEEEQFNAANKGMDWALLGWHIDQFIQNKIKYEQDRDGVLQLVRNELNFQMEEKGLQYPE